MFHKVILGVLFLTIVFFRWIGLIFSSSFIPNSRIVCLLFEFNIILSLKRNETWLTHLGYLWNANKTWLTHLGNLIKCASVTFLMLYHNLSLTCPKSASFVAQIYLKIRPGVLFSWWGVGVGLNVKCHSSSTLICRVLFSEILLFKGVLFSGVLQ